MGWLVGRMQEAGALVAQALELDPNASLERVAKMHYFRDPAHLQGILDALRAAPRTTGELCKDFEMSRFGVMKHLAVLVDAGVVLVERRGRERWNHLNAAPIQEIYRRWIRSFEAEAADRLLRLKRRVETSSREPNMSTSTIEFGVATLAVEVTVDSPAEAVWRALLEDTSSWWHKDFYIGATPRRFVIEESLGGQMYEDWGDGQGLVWARVIGLQRCALLQLSGESDSDCGGPNRNIMKFTLEEEEGRTRLRLVNTIYGHIDEAGSKSLESGWKLLLEDCLKPWVESGTQPELPATLA